MSDVFYDVWIIALIFYLILKWKKLEEFQEGAIRIRIGPAKSVSALEAETDMIKLAVLHTQKSFIYYMHQCNK